MNWIKRLFSKNKTTKQYVITQMKAGVKYYYMGEDSKWTPMFEDAKRYKKKPDFDWISDLWHKVEEY